MFAVVNNSSVTMLKDYASNLSSGAGREYFTKNGTVVPFKNIVTTLVTDMSRVFQYNRTFNEDISSWDTSNVQFMIQVFEQADVFNKDISKWNVANVYAMTSMFEGALAFNQNLNGWNVGKVTNSDNRINFANGSPLALPANSGLLPNWP